MNNSLKYAVVIPARYQSTRFPGKPLVDICGKPMIKHVWERSCQAVGKDKVYIATDSRLISDVATDFGANVVITSPECLTGTDRIAEANIKLDCDFIINVQGDEPLINPSDIKKVVNFYLEGDGSIVNAMCEIENEQEFNSLTIPKVVCSESNRLLYMSRSPIPITKIGKTNLGFKQVCIYAFSKEHLEFFASKDGKTPLEKLEDIEILRFLESDYCVNMIQVGKGSVAVDVPDDVSKVESIINKAQ